MSDSRPLELRMEPQPITYDEIARYLPEKWEMVRDGKLLYEDEEVASALRLLVFNLGVRSSLKQIPRHLIEQYLRESDNEVFEE